MKTEEANKAVVRRYIEEVINQGKVDLIDTLFAPPMREQVKGFATRGDDAFPDGHEEIRDIVAEGNTVMVRWNFRGTHQGLFLGVPATGKSVEMIGFAVYYLEDGQIVDDLMIMDLYGATQQLGARVVLPNDVAG
ncbi:MAG: ester cyclase [Anaerolineales bacterium]